MECILPEEGIYNRDGFLFHHAGTRLLTDEMITRLHEYGTGYQEGTRFKPHEDDIIRENWAEFAAEHNIPSDDVFNIIGAGSRSDNANRREERSRRNFYEETHFWPRMCKGLPHRSGQQVRRRMIRIFDKYAHMQYGRKNPLLFAEFMDLIKNYQQLNDMRLAAERIKKPYELCLNSYERYVGERGKIHQQNWKTLWNTVTKLPVKSFKNDFVRAIKTANENAIARLTETIDFKKIAQTLSRKKKFCQEGWKDLVDALKKEYDKSLKLVEDEDAAWDRACEKTFKWMKPISPQKFSMFLRILQDYVEDVDYVPFKKAYCRMDELAQKMVECGITGFCMDDAPMKEVVFLVCKVQHILRRCEIYVFSKLSLKFKLKERIKMLSMAFDRQIEKAEAAKALHDEGRDETQKLQLSERVTTPKGYAILRRAALIEALILFTTKLDPDWVPPTLFKKYVEDDDVLKLFPEKKNNTALLSMKLIFEYRNSIPGYKSTSSEASENRRKRRYEDTGQE